MTCCCRRVLLPRPFQQNLTEQEIQGLFDGREIDSSLESGDSESDSSASDIQSEIDSVIIQMRTIPCMSATLMNDSVFKNMLESLIERACDIQNN